jgi:hypothetical protein
VPEIAVFGQRIPANSRPCARRWLAPLALTGDAEDGLLPPVKPIGRPPRDRQVINGIRWRIRTGALWRDIQDRYGPWETCFCLFRTWQRDGTGSDVLTKLQARADRYLVTVQIAALVEWLR